MISISKAYLYASLGWRATRLPRYPGSSTFPGTPSTSTSPKTTSPRGRPPSALDRYRPIESWLNKDERNWRESTPTSLMLEGGNVWAGTASKSAIIVFHLDHLTYREIPSKYSVLLLAITINPSLQRETAT